MTAVLKRITGTSSTRADAASGSLACRLDVFKKTLIGLEMRKQQKLLSAGRGPAPPHYSFTVVCLSWDVINDVNNTYLKEAGVQRRSGGPEPRQRPAVL